MTALQLSPTTRKNLVEALSKPPQIPEVANLLAAKPGAFIVLLQGSFRWPHQGHVELIHAAANVRFRDNATPPDLVVILPTYAYDRKPALQSTYMERLHILREIVRTEFNDTNRIVVSGMSNITAGVLPGDLIRNVLAAHPSGRFAYVLGADSYNDSVRWGLPQVSAEHRDRLQIVATSRAGYQALLRDGDVYVEGPKTQISSTELRSLPPERMAKLVPPITRSIVERTPSAALMDGYGFNRHWPSFNSLKTPRFPDFRPQRGLDLLAGVHEAEIDGVVRAQVTNAQACIAAALRRYHANKSALSIAPATEQVDPQAGHNAKVVVKSQANPDVKYLFKPMPVGDARRVEFATAFANLLGVGTPPAIYDALDDEASDFVTLGIFVPWIDGLRPLANQDCAHPVPLIHSVAEDLLLGCWVDQILGNLDTWPGQFLVKDGENPWSVVLHIDLDEAHQYKSAQWLQSALANHWGLHEPLENTRWRDRQFKVNADIGWSPIHEHSAFTMYGALIRDYVRGELSVDIDSIKNKVLRAKSIPRRVLDNASVRYAQALIPQPKHMFGEHFNSPEEFQAALVDRTYRSADEYCAFLDLLQDARNNVQTEQAQQVRDFYCSKNIDKIGYPRA